MDGWISIHPFWDRWLEIQPTPGGISIQWMDFHPVVGIPSILDGFPTAWMEIQPLGLVGLDVVVSHDECFLKPAHLHMKDKARSYNPISKLYRNDDH